MVGPELSRSSAVQTTVARPMKPLPQPRTSKLSSSGDGFSVFSLIARLVAWYALYTVLFRCPDQPASDSPGICHPAHTVKIALRPHLQPYYDAYVSPYVQQYSPYVQQANKEYIIPAYNTAYTSYRKYGEPYVLRGSGLAATEYDRLLKPHVVTAQGKVQAYYITYMSPHAETANKLWINDVKPAVDVAEQRAEAFWKDIVMPKYNIVQPYLAKAYEKGKYVLMVIVAPVVKEGGEKAVGWGRGMWSEVVRPQVGRIGERLGGTNGNGNGVPASAVSSRVFSSFSGAKSSEEAATTASVSSMILSVSASKASDGPSDQEKKLTKEEASETIKKDLITWAAKFSASSEKTLADLKSQIDEISEKAYTDKHKSVEKEIAELEDIIEKGFVSLEADIVSLAQQLSLESSADEKNVAHDKLFAATRRLGIDIRDKAQHLRKDAESYLAKVYDDVSEAADQHLEVLDGINDMGMQELGMKWAWMDYVSYKDWAKYHDLKKGMRESRTTIIKSAEANEKLQEITKWAEDEWESKATNIAKDAAEELNRIKKVGKKKIELADASNDFTNDFIPVVAKKAGQKILDGAGNIKAAATGQVNDETTNGKVLSSVDEAKSKLEETVVGTSCSTPVSEAVILAASNAASQPPEVVGNVASENVYGAELSAGEQLATPVSEAAGSASSVASEATNRVKSKVPGGVEAGFVAAAEKVIYEDDEDNLADNLKSRLMEASKAVSQAVQDAVARETATSVPSFHEGVQSRARELSESAVYAASSILYGTPTPVAKETASIATDKYSDAVAAASSILYGSNHGRFLLKAHEAYASATDLAGDKMRAAGRNAVVVKDKPIQESMYAIASQQFSAALSAVDASYTSILDAGSDAKRNYDSAIADAKRKLDEATSAVSTGIYGTPQPVSESVISLAYEEYSQASFEAQESYDSWFYAASTQMYYGTATPIFESVLVEASVSAAAAASIFSEKTEAAASAVSQKVEDAASIASEKIYGTPTSSGISASVSSLALEAATSIVSAADNAKVVAELRYAEIQSLFNELVHSKDPTFSESVMARLSSAIYGTPVPFLSQASSFAASATSAAAQAAASMPPAIDALIADAVSRVKAAAAEASEVVYGKEPSQFEKYRRQLKSLGQDAIDGVSTAIYGMQSGVYEQAAEAAASLTAEAKDAARDVGAKLGFVEEEAYKDTLMESAKRQIGAAVEMAEKTLEEARRHVVKDEL